MAYIPHNQPTLAMYLALLNSASYIAASEDSVEVGDSVPLPPGTARNTQVSLSAVEGEGFTGEAVTFHNRLDVGKVLENVSIDVTGPPTASSTFDCIDGLNARLGIELIEEDVEDLPIENGNVVFRFTPKCMAYIGELTCTFVSIDDPRPSIESVIQTPELGGFGQLESTDALSTDLLLQLLNAANTSDVKRGMVSFSVPQINVGAMDGNTRVSVKATAAAPFKGSTMIFYDRYNLNAAFPNGVLIPIGEYTSLHEALEYINERYPLWLWSFDVVEKDVSSPGQTMEGSQYSLFALPGTGPDVIPSDLWDYTPVIENLVEILNTGYYRFKIDRAVSYGPQAIGEPINITDLGTWEMRLVGDTFTFIRPDSTTFDLVVPEALEAEHVDFTFDQNGGLLIVFTVAGRTKLRWYNPQVGEVVVTDFGLGTTPYIAPTTWNNVIGTVEIIIVYYRSGDLRYRRQLDRYDTEYSLDVESAGDILHVGHSEMNSLFVEYFRPQSNTVANIFTESLGSWAYDAVPAISGREGEILDITIRPSVIGSIETQVIPSLNHEGEIQTLNVIPIVEHSAPGTDVVPALSREGAIQELRVSDGIYSVALETSLGDIAVNSDTLYAQTSFSLATSAVESKAPKITSASNSLTVITEPE